MQKWVCDFAESDLSSRVGFLESQPRANSHSARSFFEDTGAQAESVSEITEVQYCE